MGFELTEEEQEELSLFENEQGSGLDVEPEFDDSEFALDKDEEDEIASFDNDQKVKDNADFEYANDFANKTQEDFDIEDDIDNEVDNEFKFKHEGSLPTTRNYTDDDVVSSILDEVPKVSEFFNGLSLEGKLTPEKAEAFGKNAEAILGLINTLGKNNNEVKDNWLVKNVIRPFGKGSEGTTNRNHLAFDAMNGNRKA